MAGLGDGAGEREVSVCTQQADDSMQQKGGGARGVESRHQRQGTLLTVRVLGFTCQCLLQLVSVVGALQQASQGDDDVFKAWALEHVLAPTVLKHNHKAE